MHAGTPRVDPARLLEAMANPSRGTASSSSQPLPEAPSQSTTVRGPAPNLKEAEEAEKSTNFDTVCDGSLQISHPASGQGGSHLAVPSAPGRFPKIRPYSRGTALEAARLLSNPEELESLQHEFNSSTHAASTISSMASRRRLWARMANARGFEPFDFSPEMIMQTIGILWAAGYRSAMATAWQAKRDFEEKHNGVFTPALRMAFKNAERACTRGLGPPRQSIPFPVARILELPHSATPRVPGGPLHPQRVDVCCCWLAFRGIEAAAAKARDVHVIETEDKLNVTVTLSASKSDPGALGVSRTHSCACPRTKKQAAVVKERACPACALAQQSRWAKHTFGDHPHTPLFPDERGAALSSSIFVDHIEQGFKLLNIQPVSHTGSNLAGEHSYRNGIAQFLAHQGIEVWLIQGLLRHSFNSQTVLRYIREAHIVAANNLPEQAWLAKDFSTVRAELKGLQYKAEELKALVMANQSRTTPGGILPILDAQEIEEILQNEEEDHQEYPQAATAEGKDFETATETLAPPAQPSLPQPTLRYVVCTYARQGAFLGRTHTINPEWPAKTLCGWKYPEGHIVTDDPFGEADIGDVVPRCGLCLKREEERGL